MPTQVGPIQPPISPIKTTTYVVTDADTTIQCDATAGDFTVTLPTAVGRAGRIFTFVKIGGLSVVTVDPDGAELIGVFSSYALYVDRACLIVQSTGTGWEILADDRGQIWALLNMSAVQDIVTGTPTAIVFTSNDAQQPGSPLMYWDGSDPDAITIPAGLIDVVQNELGLFLVNVYAVWEANATGYREIYLSGSPVHDSRASIGAVLMKYSFSAMMDQVTGDSYPALTVNQTSGGNLEVQLTLRITFLGKVPRYI